MKSFTHNHMFVPTDEALITYCVSKSFNPNILEKENKDKIILVLRYTRF